MAVIKVDLNNFSEEVLKSEKPVLLDMYADWCGPCMMIAPTLKEIADEYPQYVIGKVNVDEEIALAQNFGIVSIPTLILMKDGQAVDSLVGLRSKEQILKFLEG
jgi:thioredoxin 1